MLATAISRRCTARNTTKRTFRGFSTRNSKTCGVLWTGGKDCALALLKAQKMGLKVSKLLTFAPTALPDFKVHSSKIMALQSEAMGISHDFIVVTGDYEQSYRQNIAKLKTEGIDVLVTGDIDRVNGLPNWVQHCAQGTEVDVLLPLWQMDRRELLVEMLESRLQILVTGVNTRKIPEWNRVLNNFLTTSLIETMESIEPAIDLCGEQGEYHTMVLDGPMFKKPVPYDRFLIQTRVSETDDLAYMEFEERKG